MSFVKFRTKHIVSQTQGYPKIDRKYRSLKISNQMGGSGSEIWLIEVSLWCLPIVEQKRIEKLFPDRYFHNIGFYLFIMDMVKA